MFDAFAKILLAQAAAGGLGASILPHYGGSDWFARALLPRHHRFALISYPNRSDIFGRKLRLMKGLAYRDQYGFPYLKRIVFYPAIAWEELLEFDLMAGNLSKVSSKDNRS
jgi:hypothetical protein